MKVAAGRVVNGHVEVDGVALPEGCEVVVGIPGHADVGFALTEEEEEWLIVAVAEADRGEFVESSAVLATIRQSRSVE